MRIIPIASALCNGSERDSAEIMHIEVGSLEDSSTDYVAFVSMEFLAAVIDFPSEGCDDVVRCIALVMDGNKDLSEDTPVECPSVT